MHSYSLVANLRRHALALAADDLSHGGVSGQPRLLELQRARARLAEIEVMGLHLGAADAAAVAAVAQAKRGASGQVDLDRVRLGAKLDIDRYPVCLLVNGSGTVEVS